MITLLWSDFFNVDTLAASSIGYNAVKKRWFIGFKLQVVIYNSKVVQQSGFTKGNVHDIKHFN